MHLVLAGLLAGLLSSLTSGLPATFTDGANREANDELANAIATSPDPTRFRGFCVFPMASPRDAAAELRRCMTTQGFVGALVNAHLANESYYDGPAYDPLWAVAVAFHVPIYPHPTYPSLGDILDTGTGLRGRNQTLLEVWDGNVHVTTSGIFSLDPVATLVRNTDRSRILYSVDYPLARNEDGARFMASLRGCGSVTPAEFAQVAYQNAARLLKIT
ncbi:hypothetical protein PG988_011550 [Apiospora saccharicola]